MDGVVSPFAGAVAIRVYSTFTQWLDYMIRRDEGGPRKIITDVAR